MSIPGIILASGVFLGRLETIAPLLNTEGRKLNVIKARFGDWLEAGVITRLTNEQAFNTEFQGISVFIDGYLADVTDLADKHRIIIEPASVIASLYHEHGIKFLTRLRGSYECLIVDERSQHAILFGDRRSSRPLFYRTNRKDSILAAPEVTKVAGVSPKIRELNQEAITEFLISGTFYRNNCLYLGINKLAQGECIHIHLDNISTSKYWNLEFNPVSADESSLVEECDALLRQSVKRLLNVAENPFLFFSGGVDSRVVLGYLMAECGTNIPVACYSESKTQGDDAKVALDIARELGLPLRDFNIRREDFVDTMTDATLGADCRSEVIDSAPLVRFWDLLGSEFDVFFNGDECFGWGGSVHSVSDAMNQVGWFRLAQVSRLVDWLKPTVAKSIGTAIENTLSKTIIDADESDPNNLKDKIYYQERMGNMLNGFSAAKMHTLEQARPLIDEDVIDFISRLPIKLREEKSLLKKLLMQKFPSLHAMPYAKMDALPVATTFSRWILEDKQFNRHMRDNLTTNLDPRLNEMLDTERYIANINAILSGSSLPALRREWLSHVPAFWRIRRPREGRVHPVTLAMRLMQLNSYLMHERDY